MLAIVQAKIVHAQSASFRGIAVVADRLRPVVHGEGAARYAPGQRVRDRAAAGVESNRANRPLAEFRHLCAESRAFFPLTTERLNGAGASSGLDDA